MLQLAAKKLRFVPAERERIFNSRVIESYMTIARVSQDMGWNILVPSEIEVSNEIIELLNQYASLDIFEDEYLYRKIEDEDISDEFEEYVANDYYADFVHDITLVLTRNHLPFFQDHSGDYFNQPFKAVW